MIWNLNNYVIIWSVALLTIGTILICHRERRVLAACALPIVIPVAAFETYSQSQHGNWTLLFWFLTSPGICAYLLILALIEWGSRVRSSEQQVMKVGVGFVLVVLALLCANVQIFSVVINMFTDIFHHAKI